MNPDQSQILEKIRQQFDSSPYPRIPLEQSPKDNAYQLYIGFKAIRIDSKAEKPCLFPVLTIERTAANKSRPQSERKPFVTFLKITR